MFLMKSVKSLIYLDYEGDGLLTIQVSRMLLPGIIGSSAQRGGGYPSRVERGGGPGNGDAETVTRFRRLLTQSSKELLMFLKWIE